MAYAPLNRPVNGQFRHFDTDVPFEYFVNEQPLTTKKDNLQFEGNGYVPTTYSHIIYVGPNAEETRMAMIKKTVAYVIVDENENGFVVEKWLIKKHRRYS